MTSKKQVERYPLESSPFYRMGRTADLARLLRLDPKRLRSLIVRRSALYYFNNECINGKDRSLAVPIGEMRQVHERIKELLSRIILRNYLYSPRRGRSPIDNAAVHIDAKVIVKLDVRQFYPSTTDEHVFQFFHHRLRMVPDVAGRLTKICTINGKVPFGSPLSPILCALVHDDIFSRAAKQSELNGDTLSLWVDDVTISGDNVRQSLVHSIRRMIGAKRMRTHKAQRIRRRRGAVITGAFVGPRGTAPANKSHLKMKDKLAELRAVINVDEQLEITRSLIGLVNYFMTVYWRDDSAYVRLEARLAWLHNLRRKLEEAMPSNEGSPRSSIVADEPAVPWD